MAKYKSTWIAFDGEIFDTELEAIPGRARQRASPSVRMWCELGSNSLPAVQLRQNGIPVPTPASSSSLGRLAMATTPARPWR